MYLAERKHDAAMARTAVLQIKAASEAMIAGGDLPLAGYYERQLEIARSVAEQMHEH
jgi:hypothetical protein